MCDEESTDIGELVSDNEMLYLACKRITFMSGDKTSVQPEAFYKDGKNHKDGLSLATTPEDAGKNLNKYHGIIRIQAAAIHHLPYRLEVHRDLKDPTHVIVRNLPCKDREHEAGEAERVASELAVRAVIHSTTKVDKAKNKT